MSKLSFCMIIRRYIELKTDEYKELCFNLFNEKNHTILRSYRIPHAFILDLLRFNITNVSEYNVDFFVNILKYVKFINLNRYHELSQLFIVCCSHNNIEYMKLLLNLNLVYPFFNHNAALKYAIQMNYIDIVKLLLSDIRVVRKIKSWMLSDFFVCKHPFEHYFNNESYAYFLDFVVKKLYGMRNDSILLLTIKAGNINLIKLANLISKSENYDRYYDIGYAMNIGSLPIVKLMLDGIGKLDYIKGGFYEACYNGHYQIIEYVLENNLISQNYSHIDFFTTLCMILLYLIKYNPNCAKILSLLFQYNIVTYKLLSSRILISYNLDTLRHYNMRIFSHTYNLSMVYCNSLMFIKNKIVFNECSTPLINLLKIYDNISYNTSKYHVSVGILLLNPKLNTYHSKITLLMMSKTHLLEYYEIPYDLTDIILSHICKISFNEIISI